MEVKSILAIICVAIALVGGIETVYQIYQIIKKFFSFHIIFELESFPFWKIMSIISKVYYYNKKK